MRACIAVDTTTSPATIYAGTVGGVFKLAEGSTSWSAVNTNLTLQDVRALAVDPTTIPATIYAGTYGGGVFKLAEGSTSWGSVNTNLSNQNVDALAVDPTTSPATIYAGTFVGGVFKLAEGSTSWSSVNTNLTYPAVFTLAVDPTTSPATIYAGTELGGVFKLAEGSTSWSAVNTNLTLQFVKALVVDPATSPATIYAGTYGSVFSIQLQPFAPTATATSTPMPTPTDTPTRTVTYTATSIATPSPTPTATPTATATSTETPTATPTSGQTMITFVVPGGCGGVFGGTGTQMKCPLAGVGAGHSIIVAADVSDVPGVVTCSDDAGNMYTSDIDVSNGPGDGTGIRLVICSSHNVKALSNGQNVVVTHPAADTLSSTAARNMSVSEFAGLAPMAALDRSQAATGSGTAVSSGSTASTTQASELLFGAIAVLGPGAESFTPGQGFFGIGGSGSGGNSPDRSLYPEFQIVDAIGPYAATGTLGATRSWAAGIVTYKASTPPPSITATVTPRATPSMARTVTPTRTATAIATTTQTRTATATPTSSATPSPTPTWAPTLTLSPTNTPSATPTPTSTRTTTPAQSLTPTPAYDFVAADISFRAGICDSSTPPGSQVVLNPQAGQNVCTVGLLHISGSGPVSSPGVPMRMSIDGSPCNPQTTPPSPPPGDYLYFCGQYSTYTAGPHSVTFEVNYLQPRQVEQDYSNDLITKSFTVSPSSLPTPTATVPVQTRTATVLPAYTLSPTPSGTPTPHISPHVSVSPLSGPQGAVFDEPGTGFTPNGQVVLHFQKPDGTEYLPPPTVTADSNGNYSHTYTSSTSSPVGAYHYWAVDSSTSVSSNTVSFQITSVTFPTPSASPTPSGTPTPHISPHVSVSPLSGPQGTVFDEPGTGFTPNGQVVLHFQKPDGTEYLPPPTVTADSNGNYSHTYTSSTSSPVGAYHYWAVDSSTSVSSNTVSFQITSVAFPTPSASPTPSATETPFPALGLTVYGLVTNAANAVPLAGVVVTLAGQSDTTDSRGQYVLTSVDLSLSNTLTATLSGFATYSTTVLPPLGTVSLDLDFAMSPAAGSQPVVTMLTPQYDGYFLAGVPLQVDFTASVSWHGTPGTVEFYANGQLVQTASGTPSGATASIDVGNDFLGSLTPGANAVRVIARNEEGRASAVFTKSIVVLPLPPATLRLLPDFQIQSTGRDIRLSLDFAFPDPPIDSTVTLPVIGRWGVQLGVNGSFDYTVSDGNWGLKLTSGDMNLEFGEKEVPFSINGSVSGTATATQGISFDEASLGIGLGGEYELGRVGVLDLMAPGISTSLGAIPGLADLLNSLSVLVLLDPEFSGDATFALNPQFAFEQLTASGDVGLVAKYEPDLGIAKMDLYLGGRPGMTLQVPGDLIKQLRFQAYAGVQFEAWLITLGPFEYVFVNVSIPSGSGAAEMQRAFALKPVARTSSEMGVLSRDYLNVGPPRFVANRQPLQLRPFGGSSAADGVVQPPATSANTTLVENVFPNSQPSLAAHGTDVMLLYVSDNGNGGPLQRTDIDWTLYDGSSWSAPQPILADTRAEFAPQVAFDGNGDAIAVWERVADPNFNDADITAMAQEMEIVWARWDHASQIWTSPEPLSNNTILDHQSQLAGPMADGSLLLVWTENAQNLLMGNTSAGAASADTVRWTQWNVRTQTWSAPQTLVDLTYRTSQSLAARGNTAVYVWTQDLDGNLADPNDQEIFYSSWTGSGWGATTRLTNDAVADQNVRAAVAPSGDIWLVWQREYDLVLDRNLAGNPTLARSNSQTAAFKDYALSAGPANNLVVVWGEQNANGTSARYIVYDPISQHWSADEPLLSGTALNRSFAPTWDSFGNLTVAYDAVQFQTVSKTVATLDGQAVTVDNVPQPGEVDLAVVQHALVRDVGLQAGDFTANGTAYLPGDTVTLTATVRNLGDLPVQNLQVAFYDGDPSNAGIEILPRQTISGVLDGGAATTVATTWTVPQPSAPHTLFAVVDPDGLVSDINRANNKLSVSIGGTDLAAVLLSRTVNGDGSARVLIQVTNGGAPAAPSSTLAIRYADRSGGPPLSTAAISVLSAGGLAQISLNLAPGSVTSNESLFTVTADDDHVVADIDRANNAVTFDMELPCVGDCNGDGEVTVDKILTMVNIALGNAQLHDCEAGDANHDGQVTIDEILTAVNNALNGCVQ